MLLFLSLQKLALLQNVALVFTFIKNKWHQKNILIKNYFSLVETICLPMCFYVKRRHKFSQCNGNEQWVTLVPSSKILENKVQTEKEEVAFPWKDILFPRPHMSWQIQDRTEARWMTKTIHNEDEYEWTEWWSRIASGMATGAGCWIVGAMIHVLFLSFPFLSLPSSTAFKSDWPDFTAAGNVTRWRPR